MLGRRCRRWPNSGPALGRHVAVAGICSPARNIQHTTVIFSGRIVHYSTTLKQEKHFLISCVLQCHTCHMVLYIFLVQSVSLITFITGVITETDVISILPYGNRVALVRMTGEHVRQMLEFSVAQLTDWRGHGRFLQMSGEKE